MNTSVGKYVLLGCLVAQQWASTVTAAPTAQQLGSVLGYPASELLVEDVTDAQRKLWAIPTGRERRQAVAMPDSRSLLAAYQVTGKKAATFYPMLIWIGTEGTFYKPDIVKLLEAIGRDEPKPGSKGGRGPFGPLSLAGIGKGGLYLGKIKVPSSIKERSDSQEDMAMISILHQESPGVDLRIALMANLEGGNDLLPLPGGERYYETFRPSKDGETKPHDDLIELFRGLTQLVAAESKTANAPQALPPTQSSENEGRDLAHESKEAKRPNVRPWLGSVLLGLLALIVVAFLFYKKAR